MGLGWGLQAPPPSARVELGGHVVAVPFLPGCPFPVHGFPPALLGGPDATLAPRADRERRFREAVEKVVRRGGKCLIPVFSLGRAQELLLILEEQWKSDPGLQHIPIFHASAMASK